MAQPPDQSTAEEFLVISKGGQDFQEQPRALTPAAAI
jgi:hypothetical protein